MLTVSLTGRPTKPPQMAANRVNAQAQHRSQDGVGKLRASRNAFRHGLSLPLRRDREISAKTDAIARAFAGERADEDQRMAANEVARAQLELVRIRAVRAELVAQIDLASGDRKSLRRLAALDRYQRIAHTRRRRAHAQSLKAWILVRTNPMSVSIVGLLPKPRVFIDFATERMRAADFH